MDPTNDLSGIQAGFLAAPKPRWGNMLLRMVSGAGRARGFKAEELSS